MAGRDGFIFCFPGFGNLRGQALLSFQMWAHYDHGYQPQQFFANALGVGQRRASPGELVTGVGNYTCSEGYLALKDYRESGAQGDLISATINGIKENIPSIMPYFEEHAILIKGYKWKEGSYQRPIGIDVRFHDPANKEDVNLLLGALIAVFDPGGNVYWVILGWSYFVPEGVDSHDRFVLAGGTYYGGPAVYDPKGLTQDPSMN